MDVLCVKVKRFRAPVARPKENPARGTGGGSNQSARVSPKRKHSVMKKSKLQPGQNPITDKQTTTDTTAPSLHDSSGMVEMAQAPKVAAAAATTPPKTKRTKLAVVADSNGGGNHTGNRTVAAGEGGGNGASPLTKPDAPFSLDRFKSKRDKTLANVEVDPGPLPVSRITDVRDFVRVHHDEENFWTDDLCFISVPIKE
jgi:hypothetical protein